MKVLLLGHSGQLGKSLLRTVPNNINLKIDTVYGRKILIEQNLKNIINNFAPNILINSLAYTNVEKAENDDGVYDANSYFLKTISKVINKKTFLIHISTDYVFDGNKNTPYQPLDITNPINKYGKSKLLGENNIKKYIENYNIIRTSSLFSKNGVNFVKKMINLIRDKKRISVVNDQLFIPTPCEDLSQLIWSIVLNHSSESVENQLYHFSGNGRALTWFDFANLIKNALFNNCIIEPQKTINMNFKAKRPLYSVLSSKKIINKLDYKSLPWEEYYLNKTINELIK